MTSKTKTQDATASLHPACSAARERIGDLIRKLWLEYRRVSEFNADFLTEQDMELWEMVTRHYAIQSRLNGILQPNGEVSEVADADSTKTSGVRPPLSLD